MNFTMFLFVGSVAGLLGAVFGEAKGTGAAKYFCVGIFAGLLGGLIPKHHDITNFAFWGSVGVSMLTAGFSVFIFSFLPQHKPAPNLQFSKVKVEFSN